MCTARVHFLRILVLMLTCISARPTDANADTRKRNHEPTEVYGPPNAAVALRIGNGGAGPTGILRALAEDFITHHALQADIAWIQNITRLTLDNLRHAEIDVGLTYEPWLEERAQIESWGSDYAMVFYDHFLIVGPKGNPAGVVPTDTPGQAFAKIAAHAEGHRKPIFLSRDDGSGTNRKEQAFWRQGGLRPWEASPPWYIRDPVFPQEALMHADMLEVYTLTDRGTWLSTHEQLAHTEVFLQGTQDLLNPCHALLGPMPSPMAVAFYGYLLSHRAQTIIADFGRDRYNGEALFAPAAASQHTLLSAN